MAQVHEAKGKGRMQKRIKKAAGILFPISWLLCGCSVETFFEGGAPIAVLAVLVATACAIILGGNDEQRND